MGLPLLLSDNLANTRIYPLHTLLANEEATGHQAFRVANGRRSALDYWTPTTFNAQATLTLTFDRVRAFDGCVLDRGHNLAGKQVIGECSDDSFATTQTLFDVVLPSASAAGDVDDALGVRTDEGAWIKRHPARSAMAWRLRIPAMGASLKPQIVGLYAGLFYSPSYLGMPHEPDADEFRVVETSTEGGAVGRNAPLNVRTGMLRVRLTSLFEYEAARWPLGLFLRGKPTWIVHDEERAERALLAVRSVGRAGLAQDREGFYPHGDLPFQEVEALR